MIDFPLADLMDQATCVAWLSNHLHPNGLVCPHCGSSERRLFREQGAFPAYGCRGCDGYYTMLTGTPFAKTRQAPATLVLVLRGIAKGEPTIRLARELRMDRKRVGELRQQLQGSPYDTLPSAPLEGTTIEADELYQSAGGKKYAAP